MSRTVKDVLNEYRQSTAYAATRDVDWAELESRINYYIQTEVERQMRLDEWKWYQERVQHHNAFRNCGDDIRIEGLCADIDQRIAALERECVKA